MPSFPSGPQRQMDIYQKGVAGVAPSQPISLEELEAKAKEVLEAESYDYLAGGAGSEDTIRANLQAFRRWSIVPRYLRNVAQRNLSIDLFGQHLPAPLLLAPIGVQSILHKKAELAVARAAHSLGVPMILSTLSSTPLEEVADAMKETPHWFQLYWPNHDELAASFVQRAEKAGYSAIVVTLDTYYMAWRERDLQRAYLPFLKGEGLANYFTDPVFQAALGGSPKKNANKAVELFGQLYSNPALTWDKLAFLRKHTRLPILVKGVLHPDDGRRAIAEGMDGVIVSNHGGRQLDGAIAALDALPKIVEAVGGQTTILFDSGIRRGADVFKAIALGAKAVLLGRPYCFGLALDGEDGVCQVLLNLLADIDLTLALAGCASFAEVNRDFLAETSR